MNQPLQKRTVALLASMALAATAWVSDAGSTEVPHRSGGVSVEEFAGLNRQASDYSLRLVLAARGSGAYLADVGVTVRSLPARDVVLEHRTDGPLLLATLPPGRYELTASFADVLPGAPTTVTRVINVPRSGLAQTVVYFDTGDTVGAESPPEYRLN